MSSERRLTKELTLVVVVKIAVIILAGFTIFGAAYRISVDPPKMTAHLFNQEP